MPHIVLRKKEKEANLMERWPIIDWVQSLRKFERVKGLLVHVYEEECVETLAKGVHSRCVGLSSILSSMIKINYFGE